MLKRIIGATASIICATALLAGCGGSSNAYSLNEKNTVDGIVEYKIKNIELVDRIDPTNPNEQYNYFKASKPENKLLDVEIEVKNLKADKVNAKELLDSQMGTVKMADGNKVVESIDGGNLLNTAEETIGSNESRIMHFIYEVDPKVLDTKVKLDIIVGEKRFSNKVIISELNYSKNKAKIGDTITKENYAEVKILSIKDEEKLKPSNPQGVSTYYYSQHIDGKLKVLEVDIKNLSDKELMADKIISFSGVYGDEIKYSKASCEDAEGKNIEYASTVKIAPNETKKVYLYYDMKPEEFDKVDQLKIGFGMEKYILE